MAAGDVKLQDGTILLINGEAGADFAWSVENLADNAGRVSIQIDLGVPLRAFRFNWIAQCQWVANPTQFNSLDFYAAAAIDGFNTEVSGDVGVADAALGDVDQLRNVKPFGSIIAEEANTTIMRNHGILIFTHRYLSLIALNRGGAALNATDSLFKFRLLPVFDNVAAS